MLNTGYTRRNPYRRPAGPRVRLPGASTTHGSLPIHRLAMRGGFFVGFSGVGRIGCGPGRTFERSSCFVEGRSCFVAVGVGIGRFAGNVMENRGSGTPCPLPAEEA